jgi:hypothetical protein
MTTTTTLQDSIVPECLRDLVQAGLDSLREKDLTAIAERNREADLNRLKTQRHLAALHSAIEQDLGELEEYAEATPQDFSHYTDRISVGIRVPGLSVLHRGYYFKRETQEWIVVGNFGVACYLDDLEERASGFEVRQEWVNYPSLSEAFARAFLEEQKRVGLQAEADAANRRAAEEFARREKASEEYRWRLQAQEPPPLQLSRAQEALFRALQAWLAENREEA